MEDFFTNEETVEPMLPTSPETTGDQPKAEYETNKENGEVEPLLPNFN